MLASVIEITMDSDIKSTIVKIITRTWDNIVPLRQILAGLDKTRRPLVMGDFTGGQGRYSMFSPGSDQIIRFCMGDKGDPLAILDKALQQYKLVRDENCDWPFLGGWAGWLSYDLGRYVERLPDGVIHDISLPLLYMAFYDYLAIWDHHENCGVLIALEYQGQKSLPGQRLDELGELLNSKYEQPCNIPVKQKTSLNGPKSAISRDDYLKKVERVRKYIRAGDVFEVNISQRFACDYNGDACDFYATLVERNPAQYAALVIDGSQAVVSVSPELFLRKRGKEIITKPIKGTARRGSSPAEDTKKRQWLIDSAKDRAELNMIIDLQRNDLGRVCEYGSVKVITKREIEEHPTVFHAVATVAGQLRDNVSIGQILRATFPGGSITGAPKIRAMEIIDELEPTARSVYTGSVGWFGLDGDMELNIAIRTVILDGKRAYVQVGGAVVIDSNPSDEYDETLAKAEAILEVLRRFEK